MGRAHPRGVGGGEGDKCVCVCEGEWGGSPS